MEKDSCDVYKEIRDEKTLQQMQDEYDIDYNGAKRWKEFIAWWNKRFPAQSRINKKYTASQVINEIEDKIFELRTKKEPKRNSTN